jgi:hypothetical protein
MIPTTLRFIGLEDSDDVLSRLPSQLQGFSADLRRPLASELGDVIAIAGLVLNVAQLALALYQIRTESKKPGAPEIVVEIERPDGSQYRIQGQDVSEIQVEIEQNLAPQESAQPPA